jgi:phenylalanyl-tRNA synthetase beta chain
VKASHLWLRELLPSIDASPRDFADRLTGAGLEVEALVRFGAACDHVLVAKVVLREPHPTRPKLSLVTIDLGGGRTERVVCGAPNVPEPGGLVVFAPTGTHLPAKGMTLEPKEIAGVKSEGMLCSEAELGLRLAGGDGGILILPARAAEPGTVLSKAIPTTSDTILEIGLTPNRPDGLGHVGLARELAALFGVPFTVPARKPSRVDAELDVKKAVTISIADAERCPSYGAALVLGVTVGPSPLFHQYRLEALGVRAISNVVDVTNLAMLLYGHPIHGFDLDRLRTAPTPSIIVRRATEGEPMKTLDDIERKLVADDLVIADAEGPVALAGVMGGVGSEISASTKRVLVECAYFVPRGVRRTSRRHAIHSESSHRFERGVDPGDVELVLDEAAALLVELAGGTAAPSNHVVGERAHQRDPITLRKDRMDSLLGVPVSMDVATEILSRLGIQRTAGDATSGTYVPPTHRPDLGIEADLIEEVMRVHGIERVPTVVPAVRPEPPRRAAPHVETAVLQAAVDVGLSQALVFGFTSPRALELVGAPKPTFMLSNPLGEERGAMRTSLLPGLFDALVHARRHGALDVRLFSSGALFLPGGADGLAREARSFAAVLAGARDAVLDKAAPLDILDAKGIAVAILERATHRAVTVRHQAEAARSPHLHPRAAVDLLLDGQVVGRFGLVHPSVERALDLDGTCFVIEIDLDAADAVGARTPKYKPLPVLPASTRDLAVVVHEDVPSGDVERAITEVGGELVESAHVFDLFRSDKLPAEHRSLAFHVVYRDPKAATDPDKARTLTDAEVDQRHAAVVKAVSERFGASLRA